MTLRASDLQSDSGLDSIRNSGNVYSSNIFFSFFSPVHLDGCVPVLLYDIARSYII